MEWPVLVRLARLAMGTRFEVALYGEDPVRLRAAGEEALAEIERLDAQLSLYRTDSELSGLNARAARGPVAVEPRLFRLLQQAAQIGAETDGAFDLTIAPLLECWGFVGGTGAYPDPAAVEAARQIVGWSLLELGGPPPAEVPKVPKVPEVPQTPRPPDPQTPIPHPSSLISHPSSAEEVRFTVRFLRPGVRLDLGAIGKGYALERAAALLRDNGVDCALLHGGTSTAYGLGIPPNAPGWLIAIDQPPAEVPKVTEGNWEIRKLGSWEIRQSGNGGLLRSPVSGALRPSCPVAQLPSYLISLRDCALSVSAVTGKSFVHGGQRFGHVLDPRTGFPVQHTLLAAVALASPTEADAWSTALLVLGEAGLDLLRERRPEAEALVVSQGDAEGEWRIGRVGFEVYPVNDE